MRIEVGSSAAKCLSAAALLASCAVAHDSAPIQDNSFLIEEAYNQEARVVQHISAYSRERDGGGWIYSFTQEWPVGSQRHQLSHTLPVLGVRRASGGDRPRRGSFR